MKLPVQTKPALFGAAAGAVAMIVLGFGPMGWMTSTNARRMAQTEASQAVVAAMVPFCVAKAKQDPELASMTKFRAETSSFARTQMVQSAGWATLAGSDTPNYDLASACANRLHMAGG